VELKEKVQRILKEGQKEGEGGEKRGWWDVECKESKRGVRRALREWRKKGEGGEKYRKAKRMHNILCQRKKEEEMEKWV